MEKRDSNSISTSMNLGLNHKLYMYFNPEFEPLSYTPASRQVVSFAVKLHNTDRRHSGGL